MASHVASEETMMRPDSINMMPPHEDIATSETASLDDVLRTAELSRRDPRPPDHAAEAAAFASLSRTLAEAPETVLHRLTDVCIELCNAHSAGISILQQEEAGCVFRWYSISGAFAQHAGGMTPRDFGPCGTTVDLDAPQLFQRPGRYFTYFNQAEPPIVEGLLIPFRVRGQIAGTIWILSHDEGRQFDSEDLRVLTNLASFAAAGNDLLLRLQENKLAREQAERASRAREELLATVSHDLRTPLTSVLGWAQLLKFTTDTQAVESAAAGIEGSARILEYMINDLLDVARTNTGGLAVDLRPGRIADVIKASLIVAEPLIRSKGLSLELHLAEQLPAIMIDSNRIQQVMWNLLTNSMKFTPGGGWIRIELSETPGSQTITISDSGQGINPAALATIFDRYTQASADHSGLGLGLWIARHLIELHHGTIEAMSDGAGRGTTIRITLPA